MVSISYTNLYKAMKPNLPYQLKGFTLLIFLAMAVTMVTAQTVYITKTGAKYHSSGCRYLSKSCISISLSNAKSQGYTACSVCRPSSTMTSDKASSSTGTTKKASTSTQTQTQIKSTGAASQCTATTKKGTRCKRTTTDPSGKCWQHQ